MNSKALLLIVLTACTQFAWADAEPYNRVDVRAEAGREISNDLMNAQLSIEVQDEEPAAVARRISAVMNDALKTSAAYPAVKVSSGWQTTYPLYGKNSHLNGWRGTAQIKLESNDFKAAGELIGKFQESQLHMSGISFSISPDARRQAENSLIAEAINAFSRRAAAVSTLLGGTGYKIVHVGIGTSGVPTPYPMVARASMMESSAVAAQEFAGGESRMTVQVTGTIEVLQPQQKEK